LQLALLTKAVSVLNQQQGFKYGQNTSCYWGFHHILNADFFLTAAKLHEKCVLTLKSCACIYESMMTSAIISKWSCHVL